MKKRLTLLLLLLVCTTSLFALQPGERLPEVTLQGNSGGMSDDTPWRSSSLKGKVHVLLYMDPDERKKAMPFLDRLNQADLPKDGYSTVAIVNLAATWMPNAVLKAILGRKQKELRNTQFIFDKNKTLIKAWGMKDDASNVIVLDKQMRVLFFKSGVLSKQEKEKLFRLIRSHLDD